MSPRMRPRSPAAGTMHARHIARRSSSVRDRRTSTVCSDSSPVSTNSRRSAGCPGIAISPRRWRRGVDGNAGHSSPHKGTLRQLDDSRCWVVSGVRHAEPFFRALAVLVPDATDMFLEGSPDEAVVSLMQPYLTHADYRAPAGTIWSWPGKNRRYRLKASAQLFERLSKAATYLAEPQICDHLHIYREAEPLVNWFDAFTDPALLSKTITRERLDTCWSVVGGVLSAGAG